MTPHAFGKKCAHDFLTKYANPSSHPLSLYGHYLDKWYNPLGHNFWNASDSKGEAYLRVPGQIAAGTAGAIWTGLGGYYAAPALGLGGGGAATTAAATSTPSVAGTAAAVTRPLWQRGLLGTGKFLGKYVAAPEAARYAITKYLGDDTDSQPQEQPQVNYSAAPSDYALLGGLAGAGLGGLAGAFNPGDKVEVDPNTGWPVKKKRTALRGGLRGGLLGGLAGTALGGMYGAMTQQKQSAAYDFGRQVSLSL